MKERDSSILHYQEPLEIDYDNDSIEEIVKK
jgi:hypothetical protein